MKIKKKKYNGRILVYYYILQLLLLIPLYAFCLNNLEYYKEVLLYGTDSDITSALNTIKKDLGEGFNKLVLKIFNENHDIRVYKAAVNYIKINKIKSAVEILQSELMRKPVVIDYKENVIIALSEINAKESIKKLIDIFNDENTSDRIRLAIIDAFGKIGDSNEEVENMLINTAKNIKNKKDIRAHAILSLGKIKSKKSAEFIKKILFNRYEKEIVRMYSAFSLKEIEGDNAINDLSKLINDKDPKVAEYAAKALSDIDSLKAGDALIKALRSDYDIVRYYAILGLKKIKYKKKK